ncbi:hypothetical protein WA026_015256 [Henosepilachna vigintioctopunctata]|uniref:VPS37 C-terminal domain-containing protein n=1 Tax=Henosepilachna vigintioctopunctata TaxID=420089 RepID=A0AAW1TTS1_9CUCU
MSFSVLQSDCKRLTATLEDLSNHELDQILNNDEKIEEILSEADQIYLKELQNEKETVMATNESLAEINLAREPELIEGREKLLAKSAEGEAISKKVEEKLQLIRNKNGDLSLETALALLRTAASEMEEESDGVAKKFMDEGGDLEDFLDQFLAKRKIMHLRLVKADKMSKILQRGDPTMNNMSSYPNPPPLSINSSYFPGIPSNVPPPSVPYPVGPLNMPMPPPYSNLNYFQNHY